MRKNPREVQAVFLPLRSTWEKKALETSLNSSSTSLMVSVLEAMKVGKTWYKQLIPHVAVKQNVLEHTQGFLLIL